MRHHRNLIAWPAKRLPEAYKPFRYGIVEGHPWPQKGWPWWRTENDPGTAEVTRPVPFELRSPAIVQSSLPVGTETFVIGPSSSITGFGAYVFPRQKAVPPGTRAVIDSFSFNLWDIFGRSIPDLYQQPAGAPVPAGGMSVTVHFRLYIDNRLVYEDVVSQNQYGRAGAIQFRPLFDLIPGQVIAASITRDADPMNFVGGAGIWIRGRLEPLHRQIDKLTGAPT